MDGKEIEACSKSERGSMGFWKRGGGKKRGEKEIKCTRNLIDSQRIR